MTNNNLNSTIIGVGSNIDPQKNIALAKSILENLFENFVQSEFIQTTPIGNIDQDDFLNGAFAFETDLDINTLRQQLKKIEVQCGRDFAHDKWGPRTLDLDIIVFNGEVVDDDFYERDFVKASVLNLKPDLKY